MFLLLPINEDAIDIDAAMRVMRAGEVKNTNVSRVHSSQLALGVPAVIFDNNFKVNLARGVEEVICRVLALFKNNEDEVILVKIGAGTTGARAMSRDVMAGRNWGTPILHDSCWGAAGALKERTLWTTLGG